MLWFCIVKVASSWLNYFCNLSLLKQHSCSVLYVCRVSCNQICSVDFLKLTSKLVFRLIDRRKIDCFNVILRNRQGIQRWVFINLQLCNCWSKSMIQTKTWVGTDQAVLEERLITATKPITIILTVWGSAAMNERRKRLRWVAAGLKNRSGEVKSILIGWKGSLKLWRVTQGR